MLSLSKKLLYMLALCTSTLVVHSAPVTFVHLAEDTHYHILCFLIGSDEPSLDYYDDSAINAFKQQKKVYLALCRAIGSMPALHNAQPKIIQPGIQSMHFFSQAQKLITNTRILRDTTPAQHTNAIACLNDALSHLELSKTAYTNDKLNRLPGSTYAYIHTQIPLVNGIDDLSREMYTQHLCRIIEHRNIRGLVFDNTYDYNANSIGKQMHVMQTFPFSPNALNKIKTVTITPKIANEILSELTTMPLVNTITTVIIPGHFHLGNDNNHIDASALADFLRTRTHLQKLIINKLSSTNSLATLYAALPASCTTIIIHDIDFYLLQDDTIFHEFPETVQTLSIKNKAIRQYAYFPLLMHIIQEPNQALQQCFDALTNENPEHTLSINTTLYNDSYRKFVLVAANHKENRNIQHLDILITQNQDPLVISLINTIVASSTVLKRITILQIAANNTAYTSNIIMDTILTHLPASRSENNPLTIHYKEYVGHFIHPYDPASLFNNNSATIGYTKKSDYVHNSEHIREYAIWHKPPPAADFLSSLVSHLL